MLGTHIAIPTLLKVGDGTINGLGTYLKDSELNNVVIFFGNGLIELFGKRIIENLINDGINIIDYRELDTVKIEDITELAFSIDGNCSAIIGIGGGKVIDTAKYAAYLRKLPFISIPTSASSDGFSSASASLIVNGRRKSVPARMAYGIVVDTEIIKGAPDKFIYSGIGDMVSKITAVYDWQYEESLGLATVNDFAVMVAKKAVNSFVRTPFESIKDNLFLRELVESLTLSGIANEVAGGSTPTSGSEHLISHALDKMSEHPQLHGIQVGIATYVMSVVQNHRYNRINEILERTGFWNYVESLYLNVEDYIRAVDMAPEIKPNRHTYLHEERYRERAKNVFLTDKVMKRIFHLKEKKMNYEGLFFDLDGTMWDATENLGKSWNLALLEIEELNGRQLTTEEIAGQMGLPMDKIVANLFPELTRERQLEVLERCCEVENKYLTEHGGILYPELEETLKKLSERFTLCIVSNGQSGYIQTFLAAHKLSKYFKDIQNWGDHKVHKGENIKWVMERNNLTNIAYIGDTAGDQEAAKLAGVDFIYARYGFGQANEDECAYIIDAFKELADL